MDGGMAGLADVVDGVALLSFEESDSVPCRWAESSGNRTSSPFGISLPEYRSMCTTSLREKVSTNLCIIPDVAHCSRPARGELCNLVSDSRMHVGKENAPVLPYGKRIHERMHTVHSLHALGRGRGSASGHGFLYGPDSQQQHNGTDIDWAL